MSYYMKKPIKVKAEKIDRDAVININKYPNWIIERYNIGDILFKYNTFKVKSLEGWMESKYNSYIVCGPKNDIYIVQEDIFESTYDYVGE